MKHVAFLLFLYTLISCGQNSKIRPRPNIIIIFTDDQGYQDLGCFGSPDIKTPNIDQLAREGIKLTDFYVAQPVCSASRAALLTGCYPNRIGIHGAYGPNSPEGLNEDETTIAEVLKSVGYVTGIFGKWHLGHPNHFSPLDHGFDEFFGIPYSNDMWPYHPWQGSIFNFPELPLYSGRNVIDTLENQSQLTRQITQVALDFIKNNRDTSFFLYVPHPQPHVPLFVSDDQSGKSKRGLYGDVISEIDWSTGQIMEALDEFDLTEHTLIIFTSDNGPWLSYGTHSGESTPLREGKGTAWEGGIRVPCVMRYPPVFPQGEEIGVNVMTIDLLPTIAEIANAPEPANKIDGKSILDVLTGRAYQSRQEAYYIYYHQNEMHAVRHGDWKLYYPHTYRTLSGRPGKDDGQPIDYEYINLQSKELYNLAEDISEETNVFSLYPEIVAKIDSMADDMRIALGDRLREMEGRENREVGQMNK